MVLLILQMVLQGHLQRVHLILQKDHLECHLQPHKEFLLGHLLRVHLLFQRVLQEGHLQLHRELLQVLLLRVHLLFRRVLQGLHLVPLLHKPLLLRLCLLLPLPHQDLLLLHRRHPCLDRPLREHHRMPLRRLYLDHLLLVLHRMLLHQLHLPCLVLQLHWDLQLLHRHHLYLAHPLRELHHTLLAPLC